jgi:MFS family permease
MASTVGVLLGYVITAAFITNMTWHWSFYFQSLCIVPIWLFLAITPSKYLDIQNKPAEQEKEKESPPINQRN